MVEIYEAGLIFDRKVWEGELGSWVLVEFPDDDVEALTHGRLRSLKLRTQHEVFDERVSRLTLDMAQEMLFGDPNSELYVQGLCMALLGVLARSYASQPSAVKARRQPVFSRQQKRRISELCTEEFGAGLSLNRLAAEVGMSPQHFSRLFKTSFGTTPHEFVQTIRMDAAVKALQHDMHSAIADVALACGYSSQSHLTHVMRRRLGITPTEARRHAAPG